MESKSVIGHEELRKFVTSLQTLAGEKKSPAGMPDKLKKMRLDAFGGKEDGIVELSARSIDSDQGTLRVLEPTASVASANVKGEVAPSTVDFYLTRPAGAGVVETRLLGTAKHPNSDGSWSVRFLTDRFAVSADDAVLLHAEILGRDGRLLAVAANHPIT